MKPVKILLSVAAAAAPMIGCCQATFRALGYLPMGFDERVLGMSRNGTYVVGQIQGPDGISPTGFAWTPTSGLSSAMGQVAWDASNAGEVAGQNITGGAFLYQPGMGARTFSALYVAEAVSSDGQMIAGPTSSPNSSPTNAAVILTSGNGFTGSNLPPVTDTYGPFNVRLNQDGSVVSGSYTGTSNIGFRWTQAGGLVQIASPSFAGLNINGLSDDGSILVGWGQSIFGPEAIRWRASDGVQGLGFLDYYNGSSTALGVSSNGNVVVGQLHNIGVGTKAFLWTPTMGMQYLDTYLRTHGVSNLGNWNLEAAVAVSSDGKKIAGYGLDESGNLQGFYVTIQPPAFADSPSVSQLSLAPSPRVGGNDVACSITLTSPAPAFGARVALFGVGSINPKPSGLFGGQGGVLIPQGASQGVANCSTTGVSSPTVSYVQSVVGNTSVLTPITLIPADLKTPTFSANPVVGGTTTQLTLPLNGQAPDSGGTAKLTSSDPSVASVPATATFGSFATSQAVTVTTFPVVSVTPVTITATYRGNKRQVVLTVVP